MASLVSDVWLGLQQERYHNLVHAFLWIVWMVIINMTKYGRDFFRDEQGERKRDKLIQILHYK